mmetsp:Transcript_9512/g.28350  ORF Transcript_9512/g.28350 Transcript_9512/m.28350 type:complete len:506 (-) Transcript_9512:154-1671(-)
MTHSLQRLEHDVQGIIVVVRNHLEGGKQFGNAALKVFFFHHFFQRNKDGRGLYCTIDVGNPMPLEFLASPQYLGTGKTGQFLGMVQNLLRCNGQDGAHREIVESAGRCPAPHLVQQVCCVLPVFVDEANGLCRTFLSDRCVGVLIALPSHVVHVAHIGPENLPVETGVLDLDLAVGGVQQKFCNPGASRELRQSHRCLDDELLRDHSPAVQEIHVGGIHATIDQEPQELFHDKGNLFGRFQHWFVPHEQRSHELQDRDFQGKVERSDECHGSVRPAVPDRHLAVVISGNPKRFRQAANVISRKIVEEIGRDLYLTVGLSVRLGDAFDDALGEKFGNLGVRQSSPGLSTDLSVLHVALGILERIVETRLGHFPQALVEGFQLQNMRIGSGKDGRSIDIERVRNGNGVGRRRRRGLPLAVHQVLDGVGLGIDTHGLGIRSRPRRNGTRSRKASNACRRGCRKAVSTDGAPQWRVQSPRSNHALGKHCSWIIDNRAECGSKDYRTLSS